MSIILESINDSKDNQIYTTREKELLHELRIMLKDTPDEVMRSLNTLVEENRGERWSDTSLLIYLNQCMADINCEPAQTNYDLNSFPLAWKACVINGAMVMALISESVLQVGEQFSYSDKFGVAL